MSQDEPKSAYELAMERLRKKDAESGVIQISLTDDQKAEIADVRNRAEARIAELKILHESKVVSLLDPDARALADAELRRDVQRVEEDRENKIARIREQARVRPEEGA
jgi:hypothetical protein